MHPQKICILPWIHLAIFPGGHVLHCCQRSENFYIDKLGSQKLQDVFNHEKMKGIRRDFVEGRIPESCRSCIESESQGAISWRIKVNQRFKRQYDHMKECGFPIEVPLSKLCYLDLRFSNVCQSSCRICGPHFSTAWNRDAVFLCHDQKELVLNTFSNCENFKEDLYHQANDLEEIYFSGGDPLLHIEHVDLLKYLVEAHLTKIKLCYNTNLPNISDEHLHLWSHFSEVVLSISVDATEKRGEYIRKGQKWKELWDKIDFLKKHAPHIDISFSVTLSIYNAFSITELFDYLLEKGCPSDSISLNLLTTPKFLSVRNLPDQMKKQVRDNFILFQNEKQGTLKCIFNSAIAELEKESDPKQLQNFKKFNERLDLFRNENFLDVFPEYLTL